MAKNSFVKRRNEQKINVIMTRKIEIDKDTFYVLRCAFSNVHYFDTYCLFNIMLEDASRGENEGMLQASFKQI